MGSVLSDDWVSLMLVAVAGRFLHIIARVTTQGQQMLGPLSAPGWRLYNRIGWCI